ncbi:carbon-nitrogen hydrolase family protein [Balneola sp. MJW-20]|uniref:carbon-nitrogen hydrolase family protein n=1 Tax=Gracilimonas aurantiaca TaxID=3234185 RepID=UPI003466B33A
MTIKVSLIQHTPAFFDKEAIFSGMERTLESEAQKGADLIVFPESFIPGYPRGFSFGAKVGSRSEEGRDHYRDYHKSSVDLSTEDGKRLEEMARRHGVYLCVGLTEKVADNGSLYCSMVYICPDKGMLGTHRKIKPTASERVIWAEGDGSDLITCDTKLGRMGGLICWENYMPEARLAMYRKGVQLYIAPTADARDNWIASMQHIALEGRCFVLACNQYVEKKDIPEKYRSLLSPEPEVLCRGGSVIMSPMGEILAGPLWNKTGIVSAELDTDEITRSKLDFDVNGHYARPDIFHFDVKDQPDTV